MSSIWSAIPRRTSRSGPADARLDFCGARAQQEPLGVNQRIGKLLHQVAFDVRQSAPQSCGSPRRPPGTARKRCCFSPARRSAGSACRRRPPAWTRASSQRGPAGSPRRPPRPSVSSMCVPCGSQKSTINCGRVESGKKLCLTEPKPHSDAAKITSTAEIVSQRARMQLRQEPAVAAVERGVVRIGRCLSAPWFQEL